MSEARAGPWQVASRVARFARRVVAAFLRNRGILLAGGVGFNALLSLVPFVALTLAILSSVVDEALLLGALRRELNLLLPEQAEALLHAAQSFRDHATATSALAVGVLFLFSTLAFRMLEQAVATIFHASGRTERRHPWLSAILPFLVVVTLMAAVLGLTLVASLAAGSAGWNWFLLRLAGFAGLVILFAGTYWILPVGRVSRRLALIGGLSAAILWRGVGLLLAYWFSSLSMVNALYGSLATVVVLLLYLEAAFIVVLLGAQVIAELEASAAAGLPWYEPPPGGR